MKPASIISSQLLTIRLMVTAISYYCYNYYYHVAMFICKYQRFTHFAILLSQTYLEIVPFLKLCQVGPVLFHPHKICLTDRDS